MLFKSGGSEGQRVTKLKDSRKNETGNELRNLFPFCSLLFPISDFWRNFYEPKTLFHHFFLAKK